VALKRRLTSSEYGALSAERKADYVERNGAYFLDTDDANELTSALEKTKGELAEMKRQLAGMQDIDREEYDRLKKAAVDAERQKEMDKGNFEKLLEQDRKAHGDELKKRDGQALLLRQQLEETLVDGELTRAIASFPGAKMKPLLLGAKQFTKLIEANGRQRAVVVDDKGDPRLKAGAKTADDWMAPADLIAEMRNDKEWAGNFPATSTTAPPLRPIGGGRSNPTLHQSISELAQQVADGKTSVR
jgi:hypothetical protein